MKLLLAIIIGFATGCLIGYGMFREPRMTKAPAMHATVELRDRERHELKTDHL